jgi:hypothetical protein
VSTSGRTDTVATIAQRASAATVADPSTECAGQLLGIHEPGTRGRRAPLDLTRIHQHRTLVIHALRLLWLWLSLLLLRLWLLL